MWNTLDQMLDFLKTLKCEKEVNWAFGTASSTDPGPLSLHCGAHNFQLNQKLQHRPKCGPILANQSYNSFHVKVDTCSLHCGGQLQLGALNTPVPPQMWPSFGLSEIKKAASTD